MRVLIIGHARTQFRFLKMVLKDLMSGKVQVQSDWQQQLNLTARAERCRREPAFLPAAASNHERAMLLTVRR